jgi:peptidoglycan/xylan/chitin deacetylase (PgdA/CDA1 family)
MGAGRIISVFWHGVDPEFMPAELDSKDPSASLFAKQVEFLSDRYTPISIWDFLNIIEGVTPLVAYTKPPVLLGFDDGLKSVITNGLPVLRHFGAPAVFFVLGECLTNPTFLPWFVEVKHMLRRTHHARVVWQGMSLDLASRPGRMMARRLTLRAFRACRSDAQRGELLGSLAALTGVQRPRPGEVDDDLRFVDKEDVKALGAESGLVIASHAMTHRHLVDLSATEQAQELSESDSTLRMHCDNYCPVVAYPAGSLDASTVAIARDIYRAAFAVLVGSSYRNRYAYPRVGVGQESVEDLARALSYGRLNMILPLKKVLHRIGLRRIEG